MEIPKKKIIGRSLRQLHKTWLDVGQTARSRLTGNIRPNLPPEDFQWIRRQINSCLSDVGGVASARARAANLGGVYLGLNKEGRKMFLRLLGDEYGVDADLLEEAVRKWLRLAKKYEGAIIDDRSFLLVEENLRAMLVSPRIRLLTRFNELREGVKFLVDMRAELITLKDQNLQLEAFDREFRDLLASWFDVGFLELHRITWNAPAVLIEELARHEAVHAIRSWQDIKHRLAAVDRCCYAFIHPQMPNDPLIFVWVALTNGLPNNIQDLLKLGDGEVEVTKADTAVFYSISATQPGLDGVGFGSFLIKRVVDQLSQNNENLRSFSTLSPIPGFGVWLQKNLKDFRLGSGSLEILAPLLSRISPEEEKRIFLDRSWVRDSMNKYELRDTILALATHYLINEKRDIAALDRVANFHLSNGASMERLNWMGDVSRKGQRESACLMINYRYQSKDIESNHERYHILGKISYSKNIATFLP